MRARIDRPFMDLLAWCPSARLVEIPAADGQGTYQVSQIHESFCEQMYDLAGPLHLSIHPEQARTDQLFPECIQQAWIDNDIHAACFVFPCDEKYAARRARALPTGRDAGYSRWRAVPHWRSQWRHR